MRAVDGRGWGGGGGDAYTASDSVAVAVALPVVALMVTLKSSETVGVPLIRPLLVLTDRPAGKPLAPKLVGLLVAVI